MDALNTYDLAEQDYISGMKYKDIAEKYGVSINTVKSWKKRYSWRSPKSAVQPKEKGATKKRVQSKRGCTDKKGATKKPSTEKKAKQEKKNSIGTFVLNENQRLFCQYYVNNRNATQAYIRAYNCTWETANAAGPRLLVDVSVRGYIDELLRIKRELISLEADDLVERQMRIAFADMTDFVEFGRTIVPVMTAFGPLTQKNPETGEPEVVYKQVNDVRFKESTEIDGGLVCQVKLGKDGAMLKLEDRQKALDWLSKFFMINPADKHKQDFDRQRLALEEKANEAKIENLKANTAKLKGEDDDDTPDDGFLEALKGEAGKIWEE